MMYDLILRNGSIRTANGRLAADIAITAGRIGKVAPEILDEGAEVVDIRGLSVLPGVIDTQVHFREPGMQHKEDIQSGTQSAATGGVTTVLEMPNTIPPTVTREALEDKLLRTKGRAWCNIGFFVGASPDNIFSLPDLEILPGTPGVKIFMGSSTGSLLVPDDETLRAVLRAGRKRAPIHAEDYSRLEERKSLISSRPTPAEHPFLRDAETAAKATRRILELSRETGRPVHVLHVTTAEETVILADAKRTGLSCSCEVTPQHLFFAAPECYEALGTHAQMNPPIRDATHRAALRAAVKDGLFDVFGSDHAPHTLEEKLLPYPSSPSGMPGVQTLLPVLLTLAVRDGLFTIEDVVRMTSEAPAKLYCIRGKGGISPGLDADLSIVDLEGTFEVNQAWIKSKCHWSPYEGQTLRGRPVHTIVNGNFALRDGHLSETAFGSIPSFGENPAGIL